MNHKEGQELATGTNDHDWMSREQNWKLSDPRVSSNPGSLGMIHLKHTYHLLALPTVYLMLETWALGY